MYIPISNVQRFSFLYILTTFQLSSFLINSHLNNRCEMISHCILICTSLIISNVKCLFTYLLDIYMSSLEKCLFKSYAIFNWVTWEFFAIELSSLYSLDINHLSHIRFANIFPHFIGCLFIFFPMLCQSF